MSRTATAAPSKEVVTALRQFVAERGKIVGTLEKAQAEASRVRSALDAARENELALAASLEQAKKQASVAKAAAAIDSSVGARKRAASSAETVERITAELEACRASIPGLQDDYDSLAGLLQEIAAQVRTRVTAVKARYVDGLQPIAGAILAELRFVAAAARLANELAPEAELASLFSKTERAVADLERELAGRDLNGYLAGAHLAEERAALLAELGG
jgi:hypothetical protein